MTLSYLLYHFVAVAQILRSAHFEDLHKRAIFDGQDADQGKYPFFADILVNDLKNFPSFSKCGGTLIGSDLF